MKIEFTSSPDESDIDYISQRIIEETPDYGEAPPFAFFVRDNKKNILAGVNGYIIYGEIYTDQLWVKKEFRDKGIARQLMNEVHNLGAFEGCKVATVQTMCFQKVVEFYEKLGYVKEFERKGHLKNSTCYFLSKDLNTENDRK